MGRVQSRTDDDRRRTWHDAATMGEGTVGGVALRWAAVTDVGSVRAVNEDSLLADPPVFVVADGMGGHEAGDVASRLVIEEFSGLLGHGPLDRRQASLALELANWAIIHHGELNVELQGMGTTAVGLMLVEHGDRASWLLFNVGDSRAYRLADGVLEQQSVDHSYVQELVDHGQITRAAARDHPQRNVVTRALGVDGTVDVDQWLRSPTVGERWLLCSDGLSGEVDDDEITDVLRSEQSAEGAAYCLLGRALDAGGHDNVSVIVIDVLSVEEAPELDEDTAPRGLIRSVAEVAGSPDGEPSEQPATAPLIASDEVLAVVRSAPEGGGSSKPEPSTGADDDPRTVIDSVPFDAAVDDSTGSGTGKRKTRRNKSEGKREKTANELPVDPEEGDDG